MSRLQAKIAEIYLQSKDWGDVTTRRVEMEIGLSLSPAERLRWLEEIQEMATAIRRDVQVTR